MPTALSAADAQDSEQISACRLCGQLCCPVAECEQRFEDTSFGVALNALHRQGVVEERAQRFACRRAIDPKGGGFRSERLRRCWPGRIRKVIFS